MVSTSILVVLVLCLAPVLVCGNYGLLKAARAVTPMSIMEEVEAEFDFQLDQMDAFLDRKREIEASVTRLPEHLDSFVRSVVGTGSTRGEAPFNMMYDASAEMNAHTHMTLRSKCVNFMYNMVVAIVLKRVDVPSFMIEVLIWNIRRTIQSARNSNR